MAKKKAKPTNLVTAIVRCTWRPGGGKRKVLATCDIPVEIDLDRVWFNHAKSARKDLNDHAVDEMDGIYLERKVVNMKDVIAAHRAHAKATKGA